MATERFDDNDPSRARAWLTWLLPSACLALTIWSYLDPYLHPTFPGDQGDRLDQAHRLIVVSGKRHWLPFLQFHIHALYRLSAPPVAFLMIPLAYTALAMLFLAWLCRALIPERRTAEISMGLVLIAFVGSNYHWLGRSLYQEVIVIPLFLALVYLRCAAPQRFALYLCVWAMGLLTREIFWIWWAIALVVDWRRWQREPRLLAGMLALAIIPVSWLLLTSQPVVLSILDVPHSMFEGLGGRMLTMLKMSSSQALLLPIIGVLATFGVVIANAGWKGISCRRLHAFLLLSVVVIYAQTLLFDPYSPGNARILFPLYVHILMWVILAWRDTLQLAGRWRLGAQFLATAATLTILQIAAIPVSLDLPGPGARWEKVRPITGTTTNKPDDWRATLARALQPLRDEQQRPLRISFAGIERPEYLKFWVSTFLYDRRQFLRRRQRPVDADVLVMPFDPKYADAEIARVDLGSGMVRSLILPSNARERVE